MPRTLLIQSPIGLFELARSPGMSMLSSRKVRALLLVGVLSGVTATCVGLNGPIFGESEVRIKLMNAASISRP
jgi:hypothetical protein